LFIFRFSIKKYFIPQKPESVTAVIPNYNYSDYLEERVNSIVNQTYPVSELIILDDHSTDQSVKVIKKILKKLHETRPNLRTRLIVNKQNSGKVFKQWSKAFAEATGDYLWICEADDLCNKHFLSATMLGFKKDKNVLISYTESKMIDDQGFVLMSDFRPWIDYLHSHHWRFNYINNGVDELKEVSAVNNTITNVSGVVFKLRKDIPYLKYLESATNFRLAGDWYFYAKILTHGSIAYHAESLNYYRSHTGSVSKTTDNYTHFKEIVTVQDEITKDVKLPKIMLKNIKRRRQELITGWGLEEELSLEKTTIKVTDHPLLSVVIPVYNVEPYIKTCLNSIFTSPPPGLEVIIINDCSPDNSERIIRSFMKNHPEIKYKKLRKNSGLSSARNAGLAMATGDYITFLDPDDYVAINAYSTMLKKAQQTASDLVYSDIMVIYPPKPNHHDPLAVEPRKVWNSCANLSHRDPVMQIIDTDLAASACNKIFKRALFKNTIFPTGLNNEDVAIIPTIIAKANNPVYIRAPYYNYVQRDSSIQGNGGTFNKNRLVIFKTVALCLQNAQKNAPSKLEEIEGAIIPHQLLVILFYTIADIPEKTKRLEYIKLFCKKMNALEFDQQNPYIKKYLTSINATNLLRIIKNGTPKQVDRYIFHSHKRQAIKQRLKHFF
jgi:glycosyltransferase involved in cell wall biosynthesis